MSPAEAFWSPGDEAPSSPADEAFWSHVGVYGPRVAEANDLLRRLRVQAGAQLRGRAWDGEPLNLTPDELASVADALTVHRNHRLSSVAVDDERYGAVFRLLGGLADEGKLSPEVPAAFALVWEYRARCYEGQVRKYEAKFREQGAGYAQERILAWRGRGWDPGMLVEAFRRVRADTAGPSTVVVAPRRQGRASRAVRSRSHGRRGRGSPPRPGDDDDDLADARPRCPRCGAAARPREGSLLWTCDDCARAIWEQIVQHELWRVLAEADRITRGAA